MYCLCIKGQAISDHNKRLILLSMMQLSSGLCSKKEKDRKKERKTQNERETKRTKEKQRKNETPSKDSQSLSIMEILV